jgi:hypothetical protein
MKLAERILWHSNLRISLSAYPLRLKANVDLSSRLYRLDPKRVRVSSPDHGWNAMICTFRARSPSDLACGLCQRAGRDRKSFYYVNE